MKHTPAPWNLVDDYGRFEIESRLHAIATVNDNNPNHESNAALISAAPELLKALSDIVDAVYSDPRLLDLIGRERFDASRAAIRKAEGE